MRSDLVRVLGGQRPSAPMVMTDEDRTTLLDSADTNPGRHARVAPAAAAGAAGSGDSRRRRRVGRQARAPRSRRAGGRGHRGCVPVVARSRFDRRAGSGPRCPEPDLGCGGEPAAGRRFPGVDPAEERPGGGAWQRHQHPARLGYAGRRGIDRDARGVERAGAGADPPPHRDVAAAGRAGARRRGSASRLGRAASAVGRRRCGSRGRTEPGRGREHRASTAKSPSRSEADRNRFGCPTWSVRPPPWPAGNIEGAGFEVVVEQVDSSEPDGTVVSTSPRGRRIRSTRVDGDDQGLQR